MNFRSDGEGVQIEERNSIERIYKAAATRKAVLLQNVSSPSRKFSLLISRWKILHTPENVAQQYTHTLDCEFVASHMHREVMNSDPLVYKLLNCYFYMFLITD